MNVSRWSVKAILALMLMMPLLFGPGVTGQSGPIVYTIPLLPSHEDNITVVLEVPPDTNATNITLFHNATGGNEPVNMSTMGGNELGWRSYKADIGVHPAGRIIGYRAFNDTAELASGEVSISMPSRILWHHSIEEGERLSQGLDRPMMVLFHSPSSSVSEEMDEHVFTDQDVITASAGIVNVRIDADDDRKSVNEFNVDLYPTVIFFDSNGTEIARRSGHVGAGDMITEMEHAKGLGDRPENDKSTVVDPFMKEMLISALAFLLFLTLLFIALKSKRWGT